MRDLRGIQMFIAVARSGGFTRAAGVLGITPAAVSRSMARLEQELNVRLFNRTTRRFGLTEEGSDLYARVGPCLGELENAIDLAEQARGAPPEGALRVAMVSTFGKFYVLPRLGPFLDRYPGIALQVRFRDEPVDLIEEGVDVAVCYDRPRGAAHVSRVVCRPALRMAASPAYLARHGAPAGPDDLARVRFLAQGGPEAGSKTWALTPSAGGETRIHRFPNILVFDEAEGVVTGALNGLGATIAASYALDTYFASGALVRLLPDYDIDSQWRRPVVSIAYLHREHLPARIRAFVDFIVEITGEVRAG